MFYPFIRRYQKEHTGRVFRLQFDEFQIVSSSHDDTILIWDFLNYSQDNPESPGNRNNSNALAGALNGSIDAGGRSPSRKFILKIIYAQFSDINLCFLISFQRWNKM